MEEEEGKRKSRDEKIDGEGRKLCRFLEDIKWSVLNGNVEGVEKGEWTYTGKRGVGYRLCVRE